MKYVIMKMDERIKYMFGMGTNYLNILLKYPCNWIQLDLIYKYLLINAMRHHHGTVNYRKHTCNGELLIFLSSLTFVLPEAEEATIFSLVLFPSNEDSNPRVGVTKHNCSIPPFSFPVTYWMSWQLGCDDTCQIWMWFKESNGYFRKIKYVLDEEMNERICSNPHTWARLLSPYLC